MAEIRSVRAHRAFSKGFYRSADFDYEVRCALGAASHGAADAGEVLATIDDVADGDHERWFEAWLATGSRVRALADGELAAGRSVSAASSYLRAATYPGVARLPVPARRRRGRAADPGDGQRQRRLDQRVVVEWASRSGSPTPAADRASRCLSPRAKEPTSTASRWHASSPTRACSPGSTPHWSLGG